MKTRRTSKDSESVADSDDAFTEGDDALPPTIALSRSELERNQAAALEESSESTAEELLLAKVLSEITDRQNAGESVDVHQYCKQYPLIRDEIRSLFAAVVVTDTAGKEAANRPLTDLPIRTGKAGRIPATFQEFGEFELLEELGRGGMGVVFKARHRSLNRTVALKMILQGELASEESRRRFITEAHAAAKLQHPSIVSVYEVGETDGRLYFAMEYVQGRTLQEVLSDGPISTRRAAEILYQIAIAIDFAHQRGVLHRDLKPSNILITDDGEVKITDFGLAKQFTEAPSNSSPNITITGAVIGTPSFMSPEQAAGANSEVGPTSDIFSLGSLLYFTLTGKAPFDAASPMDTIMMVMDQDPMPPRILNRSTDRDLEMICLRCLQKPAELRYQKAGDLASDLEAYLLDEPISAQSGRFAHLMARMFRETHNVDVLENWGVLWMWHSLVLLIASFATNILRLMNHGGIYQYPVLWIVGLGTWAGVFWYLRRRMGPVTFVERQIAHVWAGSMICVAGLFPIEMFLGLAPLTLSPCLGLIAGMSFVIKGGILTGTFYIQAVALFLTAILMAAVPDYAHFIFGVVAALCFFIPGLKFYRRKKRNQRKPALD